ncbi:MAG TPA: pitrilysin family protein [Candidatus Deferrimicrobiaceae bacterium]|nr:pitrilysin family protein [Candidatus Deferrimicrobiaceae bacterium]
MSGQVVVADRPRHSDPRPYSFPAFERLELPNGLGVIGVHLPGRGLASASLVIPAGAADEPEDRAGVTALMARALTEGTQQRNAVELTEAAERLGASIHAEAGWDGLSVSVDVPVARLGAALDLAAEVIAEPTFPEAEVERLRDERLNDLLQALADPRRRADDGFVETIYADGSPYRRPSGGTRETVERLDAAACREIHTRRLDPARMTLVIGGDLSGLDVVELATSSFDRLGRSGAAEAPDTPSVAVSGSERLIRILHRPGAVQTEIRIGHVGLPRRIADFHALSVMTAILGGLFNSRLNRKLREEKGYTYGAGAGFELRRAAGPFAVRAAVNTDVTVPAVVDVIAELERMRGGPVEDAELHAARDYLVGVFPLRFETPPAVVGAIAGLIVHGLPFDELERYRPSIEAVSQAEVLAAARSHVRPDEAAIVLVGDADAFLPTLEGAGLGPVVVEREALPTGAMSHG